MRHRSLLPPVKLYGVCPGSSTEDCLADARMIASANNEVVAFCHTYQEDKLVVVYPDGTWCFRKASQIFDMSREATAPADLVNKIDVRTRQIFEKGYSPELEGL